MVNLRLLVSVCDVFFHVCKHPSPCDVVTSCRHSLQFCDVFFHDVKLAIHMINSSISERSPVDHIGVCTDTKNKTTLGTGGNIRPF